MFITTDIDESVVAEALSYASKNGQTFNEVISDALSLYIHDKNSDEAILNIAIQRAAALPHGEEFTIKKLMSDLWDNIESPRSFGREFKKRVTNMMVASQKGVNSSNQVVYIATIVGGREAEQYAIPANIVKTI